jgi:tubulin polyglutamylase complex subunit 2
MKEREAFLEVQQGLERCLDSNPSIVKPSWSDRCGAGAAELSAWEREHGLLLPDDMRDFYQLWDGLECRYDVVHHARDTIPLGRLAINPLLLLRPADPACLRDGCDVPRPGLPAASSAAGLRPFDLDAECESGRVIAFFGAVGSPRRVEIWFQDAGGELSRLAGSFAEYFRLAALHAGLPQWQYAYTEAGLDRTTRQWFRLLAPMRFFSNGASDRAQGDGAPSHSEALSLLAQATRGPAAAARPVAAGNPRSAIALLNRGALGGGGSCSHNSSAASTSSGGSGESGAPTRPASRPGSSAAARATGEGAARRRVLAGGSRAVRAAVGKRGSVRDHAPLEPDE